MGGEKAVTGSKLAPSEKKRRRWKKSYAMRKERHVEYKPVEQCADEAGLE